MLSFGATQTEIDLWKTLRLPTWWSYSSRSEWRRKYSRPLVSQNQCNSETDLHCRRRHQSKAHCLSSTFSIMTLFNYDRFFFSIRRSFVKLSFIREKWCPANRPHVQGTWKSWKVYSLFIWTHLSSLSVLCMLCFLFIILFVCLLVCFLPIHSAQLNSIKSN